ncbi:hypothetical protein [Hymenobacter swuensis]|uniref:Uncharacterized protein n=1 Tax=Hymenobacter swuensis DY53 TaxID=1227739 RepID=W8F5Y0_9BACT|nr:hypothetical protein [Hymenobacter swuensis]AHJ98001.1 hypothetical protein Hsw_2406 [Hymenobacter swuensis DY53]
MTRASLLHILDHVNGISDTEVRELEQLAAAFPYCQTAHLLLAKAAHDRGSMLAGQRLRRAATYAADRELLRQLLEQPAAPAATLAAVEAPTVPAAAAVTAAIPAFYERETTIAEPSAPLPAADTTPELLPPVYPTAEVLEAESPIYEVAQTVEETLAIIEPEEQPEAQQTADATVADDAAATEDISAEPVASDEAPAISASPAAEVPEEIALNDDATPQQSAAIEPVALQEGSGTSPIEEPVLTAQSEADAQEQPAASLTEKPTAEAPAAADGDLLPAVAPPIRPPAEAGISRFEFGLSEPELPVPSGYQLPDLEDEDDELPTLSTLPAKSAPAVTEPFRTDKNLGYSLGAGSRLGYDLQPHDGYTLDLPLDAFFEPDALLLAHMRAHQPKPTASSLDLINQFLKTKPRIKSPVGVPLPAAEQADLSVRSLTAAPALASESLAKIMVRQGKKNKAIEIYERLMERQPEKKAYFADQIQQLQQPSE